MKFFIFTVLLTIATAQQLGFGFRGIRGTDSHSNQGPNQQSYQGPYQQSYQNPYQQSYQNPAQQSYQNPYQQSYQNPAQHSYQNPSQHSYQNPSQHSYQNPSQHSYQNPSQQPYRSSYPESYKAPYQQSYQGPAQQSYPAENYAPRPYNFAYNVDDTYNNYGQSQSSDGQVTTGIYYVRMSDGRMQTVKYTADSHGYNADVEYEGEAKYPEYKASNYATSAYQAAEYTPNQIYKGTAHYEAPAPYSTSTTYGERVSAPYVNRKY